MKDAPVAHAQPVDALDWEACGGFECARLRVPLDYGVPDGRQIEIALLRVKAREPSQRIGSLLVNPGGPGASGNELLETSHDPSVRLKALFAQ